MAFDPHFPDSMAVIWGTSLFFGHRSWSRTPRTTSERWLWKCRGKKNGILMISWHGAKMTRKSWVPSLFSVDKRWFWGWNSPIPVTWPSPNPHQIGKEVTVEILQKTSEKIVSSRIFWTPLQMATATIRSLRVRLPEWVSLPGTESTTVFKNLINDVSVRKCYLRRPDFVGSTLVKTSIGWGS